MSKRLKLGSDGKLDDVGTIDTLYCQTSQTSRSRDVKGYKVEVESNEIRLFW